jgi:ParB family chromosome partitioning protein
VAARPADFGAENGSAEPQPRIDPEWERVETDLRSALGTKVTLARARRGGRIVIEYYSDDELSRLYDRLVGTAQ